MEAILTGILHAPPSEKATLALGLLYAILAAARKRWCWIPGGIASGIAVVLMWKAKLPMQALLNAYYVGMAVYGFWHWSRDEGRAPKQVTTWSLRTHVIAIASVVAVSLVNVLYLSVTGSDAAWPFLDSFTTWGSLLATWMTAQVKLENWLYWIVIDAILVFLCVQQNLMGLALQFAVYLVIATVGFVAWLRSRRALAPSV